MRRLEKEAGSRKALAEKMGVDYTQITNWLSPKAPRNIGESMARRAELAMKKPRGWLDRAESYGFAALDAKKEASPEDIEPSHHPKIEWTDSACAQRDTLLYNIRMSYAYNRKRQRFFDLLDKFSAILGLMAGTALCASIVNIYLGAIVLALSLMQVIFDYKSKYFLHSSLAEQLIGLQSNIETAGVLNHLDLATFSAQLKKIEAQDPNTLRILIAICQNEIAHADGRPDYAVKIPFHKKALAHFLDGTISA